MDKLFDDSQSQFDTIFTQTYGVLYERNSDLFINYYSELRKYYRHGQVNVLDTTSSFFNELFRKMFIVMNAQYSFDNEYLSCLGEHDFRPFGRVPRKMAIAVKRSLVAVRALVKSLENGLIVMSQLSQISPSMECLSAIQRMNTCSLCQGYSDIKPCPGYCLQTYADCLEHHQRLQDLWDSYVFESLDLINRLTGPFNVETVVFPIDIAVSDAIMHLQETGFQISQNVFETCGKPRLVKRSTANDTTPFIFEAPKNKKSANAKTKKSEFEIIIGDITDILKSSSGYWKRLPIKLCHLDENEDEITVHDGRTHKSGICWNGVTRETAAESVNIRDIRQDQITRRSLSLPSIFNEQKFRIQSSYNQLKLAKNGQDVEWFDQESDYDETGESGSGYYFVEGSGDFFDQGSGSGYYEIVQEENEDDWTSWTPFSTIDETTETSSTSTSSSTEEEEDITFTSTSTETPIETPTTKKTSDAVVNKLNVFIILVCQLLFVFSV